MTLVLTLHARTKSGKGNESVARVAGKSGYCNIVSYHTSIRIILLLLGTHGAGINTLEYRGERMTQKVLASPLIGEKLSGKKFSAIIEYDTLSTSRRH